MKRLLGAVLAAALVSGVGVLARAQDGGDAGAILDKAIKALGGKENLSKVKAASWKAKGKITINGSDNEFTSRTTVQGLKHYRSEFDADINGMQIKGAVVVAGDKGWRKFGDNSMDLDKDGLANERRSVYLQVVPMTLLPLKGKAFKVQAAGEEKVGGKPAVALKVTPPDNKEFTLYFDKASGLPVRLVAKVVGFMGEEFTQDTTYHDYKEVQGVKRAMHVVSKRDGEPFIEQHISDFRVLGKVDPKTFAEPQ
jgi:hypothetical protein